MINGRKRHIVTACLGLLLVVTVTAVNIGERDVATGLLTRRSCTGTSASSGLPTGALIRRGPAKRSP